MDQRGVKISVFFLLLVLYGSFLVYKIDLPAAQDLPRQIENGKNVLEGQFDVLTKNVYSYTEPNQPFTNHHWLYGVCAFLLYSAVGWSGLVIFKVLLILLTFSLLFYVSVKKKDFWLVATLSIPVIFMLISRTALRPEIFSYFFVVLFLYLILDFQENPGHKRIFWLIPLQLLWVNTHIFFGVGILMTAGFLLEKIILNRKYFWRNPVIKKLVLMLLALIVVIFINPFGLSGAVHSLQVNISGSSPVSSAEMDSLPNVLKNSPGLSGLSLSLFFPWAVVLAMSFSLALIFRWRKKQFLFSNNIIFYFLACLGSGVLSYFQVRGLCLFALVSLPAICNNFNEPFCAAKEWLKSKRPQDTKIVGIVLVFLLMVSIIWLTVWGQQKLMNGVQEGVGLTDLSLSSAQFFKDNNLHGSIFNDTDIGSYLIGELYPAEKVFTDNRFGDAYSPHFFSDILLPMMADEKSWQNELAKYNFNVIFFYHYDAGEGLRNFLYRRFHDKDWALVYADNYALIFVRNVSANKAIIDKFHITNGNIADKLKYLSDSSYSENQLAAADIFNLFGRTDLSMPAYLKFLSEWPSNGKVWMILGEAELNKTNQADSNPLLATIYLQMAISSGYRTWESYSYLALAYYRTGQIDRARAAVNEERKIDPENLDGQKWLGILADQALSNQ